MSLFKKISLWVLGVLVFSFIILVAVRTVHFFNLDKTNAEVEKIHATKLTLNDVMGKNLPPDPGAEADKTGHRCQPKRHKRRRRAGNFQRISQLRQNSSSVAAVCAGVTNAINTENIKRRNNNPNSRGK